MSINLLELMEKALSNQVVDQIAETLKVDKTGAAKAVDSSLPSLLGGFIEKASTDEGAGQLGDVLDEADGTILDNIGEILDGADGGADRLMEMGKDLVSGLLGDRADEVIDQTSTQSGLDKEGATSLIGLITPILFSLLGKQKEILGLDASGISKLLLGQREHLKGAVPGLPGVDPVAAVADPTKEKAEEVKVPPPSIGGVAPPTIGAPKSEAAEKAEPPKGIVPPIIGAPKGEAEKVKAPSPSTGEGAMEKFEPPKGIVPPIIGVPKAGTEGVKVPSPSTGEGGAEKSKPPKGIVPPTIGAPKAEAEGVKAPTPSAGSPDPGKFEPPKGIVPPTIGAAKEGTGETKEAAPSAGEKVIGKLDVKPPAPSPGAAAKKEDEGVKPPAPSIGDAVAGKVDAAKAVAASSIGAAKEKASEAKGTPPSPGDAVAGKVEVAKDAASSAADTAKEKAEKAKETASATVEKAAGKVEEIKEKAVTSASETVGSVTEKTTMEDSTTKEATAKSGGGFLKFLITIIIIGAIGFGVWKFVLPMLSAGGATPPPAPESITAATAAKTMNGAISNASSILRGIKDVPSAEAAIPRIDALAATVRSVASLKGSISGPDQQEIKKAVTDFAPKFIKQLEKAYGIPGVKAVLEPKVDEFTSILEGFAA